MSTDNLKIGIVGCGSISQAHIRSYRKIDNVQVAKVFDVHRPSAEARAAETGAAVADSLADMTLDGEIDAVSICTPPGAHLESCQPFLRAGIPILCEKPFEVSPERTQLLEKAVHSSESLFMIAFCHRYNPHIQEAKRLLTEEVALVGEPLFFRNFFGGKIDLNAGHRSNRQLSGGGVLIDNCAHALDLFRYFMGEAASVSANTSNMIQESAVEDFASIDIQGKGKCAGQIVSSYSLPVVYNTVELYCSKSTISINYWIEDRPSLLVHIQGEGTARIVEVDESVDQYAGEIAAFVNRVRHGQAATPGIDDAVASSALIEAAYRAASTGCRVML